MGYVAAAALLAAAVLFGLAGRKGGEGQPLAWQAVAGRIASGLAATALVTLLVARSIRIGFPALTGTYEGLLLGLAVIAGAVAIGPRLFGDETRIQAIIAGITFLGVVVLSSPLVAAEVYPPLPILRSAWLVVHVAFAFVGLSLFTVAAVATFVGIVRAGRSGSAEAAADGLRDRAIVAGFIFYATGGLVFGAIWAEAAWGRFWGWDPKETWALVTFIVYSVYLHARLRRWGRGQVSHWISALGYASAMFTLFGVNIIYQSLHAY